jgi:hypothetical protein
MYPIFLTVFFGAVIMYYTAIDVPAKEQAIQQVTADVSATNFIAYRKAVQKYLLANPSFSGTVSDTSLTAFWLPGYVRNPNWTNLVSGGTLYVFSTTAVSHGTIDAIRAMSGESVLFGTKSPTTGRLVAYNGFDTGIVLPAAIPNNAIVMMGR